MPGRSARMRSMRDQNCWRESGSTPVVGSSRMSRSGSWIRAQQRPTFCFMPPESLPAGRSGNGPRPGGVEQGADAAGALGVGHAEEPGEEVDVLEDAELEVEVLAQALGHVGDARAGGVAVGGLGHVAAEDADRAGLDLLRAGDQAHERGLADAVGADQADHAAGGDVEVSASSAGGPVGVRDAADRYHRRRVAVRRGGDAHAGGGHRVALRQGRGGRRFRSSGRGPLAFGDVTALRFSGRRGRGGRRAPGKGRSSRSGQAAESSSRT